MRNAQQDVGIPTRIYVAEADNIKYFKGMLPTLKRGFCWVERGVTPAQDPRGEYTKEGEYGTIQLMGIKAAVQGKIGEQMEFLRVILK